MDFVWPVNTNPKESKQTSDYGYSLSRHRSSSLRYTSLTENTVRRPRAGTMPTSQPFTYSTLEDIPSSPLDENAHNSLTSTLASLGLTDDDSSISSGLTKHYLEPTTRNRSYTVSDMIQRHPFKPFLEQETHRPRASSLSMAEISHHQFSPFDFDIQQEEEYNDTCSFYSTEKNKEEEFDLSSQTPSRALWLGNISPSIKVSDLTQIFSSYGHIESARILSDKDCAFINFESIQSALAAKRDLENKGCRLAGSIIRVGFGKTNVNLTNEASPNVQGPTRALWVGHIPTQTSPVILQPIFEAFGKVESIRILSQKNCAFINFVRQEDAVRARKMIQNKEILPGTGPIRVGFAREPEEEEPLGRSRHQENAARMAGILAEVNNRPKYTDNDSALERQLIMQQLGYSQSPHVNEIQYSSIMPTVPEFGADRQVRPLRLREIKKGLDNGTLIPEIEAIAQECTEEIVELCSDYIGNTVVQKIFEYCCQDTKLVLLQRIAPYLAPIGIHKNGTWAVQKIIELAHTEEQVDLICHHLSPFVPLLLLDSIGNYVIQQCLPMGSRNQFIFEAIVENCIMIGQGRFGSRSIRAILASSFVTKKQQAYIASSIIQHSMLLSVNPNGCILINWLLDNLQLLDQVSHVHSHS